MRILLFALETREETRKPLMALTDALSDQPGFEIYRFGEPVAENETRYNELPLIQSQQELLEHRIDIIITAGGDGTMLKAAAFSGATGIPLLGYNLGRMGFLAVVEKDSIPMMISSLMEGQYQIEERITLEVTSDPVIFPEGAFALNDFTILKRDNSSMIKIHAAINGEFLNTYWADGIILATPTGSTGYSLSCGGPIIFPQSGNFVLTPIAPHNLNVRPIVISDDSVLEFRVEGRTDSFLCTLDSQYALINSDYKIRLRKNSFAIRLVRLSGHTFLKTLRDKLMWGLDMRN
jgi:NAD+ kinase